MQLRIILHTSSRVPLHLLRRIIVLVGSGNRVLSNHCSAPDCLTARRPACAETVLPVLRLSCLCCLLWVCAACSAPGPQLASPRALLVLRRHPQQDRPPAAAPGAAAGTHAGAGAAHAERWAPSHHKDDKPPWPVFLRRHWLAVPAAWHGFVAAAATTAAAGYRGECPASL
jgi:hypothetical protein